MAVLEGTRRHLFFRLFLARISDSRTHWTRRDFAGRRISPRRGTFFWLHSGHLVCANILVAGKRLSHGNRAVLGGDGRVVAVGSQCMAADAYRRSQFASQRLIRYGDPIVLVSVHACADCIGASLTQETATHQHQNEPDICHSSNVPEVGSWNLAAAFGTFESCAGFQARNFDFPIRRDSSAVIGITTKVSHPLTTVNW